MIKEWLRLEGDDGPIWRVSLRVRIGWSRSRRTYWMVLYNGTGEEVVEAINEDVTTEPLDDFNDLAEAAIIWNNAEDGDMNSPIMDWIQYPPLIDQIMAPSGRDWSYD